MEAKDTTTSGAPANGTALHTAAWVGNFMIVRELIRGGANVNATSEDGRTPLHVAAIGSSPDIVQELIKAKCDVNAKDSEGWTPLHFACAGGESLFVDALIDSGADVGSKTGKGVTPLMLVAEFNHPELIPVVVEAGAEIDAQDLKGNTALHHASEYGGWESVKALRDSGGDPDVLNDADLKAIDVSCSCDEQQGHCVPGEECTPWLIDEILNATFYPRGDDLFLAISRNDQDTVEEILECCPSTLMAEDFVTEGPVGGSPLHTAVHFRRTAIIKMLLAEGAPLNATSSRGFTPLHTAVLDVNLTLTEMLIKAGAVVDLWDEHGYTPLHDAVSNGEEAMVELLLRYSVDPDAPDLDGHTPLMFAAADSNVEMIELLLDGGANIDLADHEGETALHEAAMYGAVEAVKVLIQNEANESAVDAKGRVPFDTACECLVYQDHARCDEGICENPEEQLEVLAALSEPSRTKKQQRKDPSLDVWKAIVRGDAAAIEELLDCCFNDVHGSRVMSVGPHKGTSLQMAVWAGNREIVGKLLEAGSNVDARGGSGRTALHWAAWRDQAEIAKDLLSAGANVTVATRRGWTALHFAAIHGSTATAKTLLENGADPSVGTIGSDETPLLMAASMNDASDIVAMLLEAGAEIDHQDVQGETALHEAVAYGSINSTTLLLQEGADWRIEDELGRTPLHMVCFCLTYDQNGPFARCAPQACTLDNEAAIVSILEEYASGSRG
ncbi:hypothetical protein BSKO_13098 [Bryopsis sp. KO-2023]|nr:hypothetical protein BSKO_13098 [Bryopsis sp. KO-2023]